MPDLPIMTLNQEHYDLVVAAFPGDTEQAKVAAYRAWLTNRLIERVEAQQLQRIAAQRDADIAAVRASLPSRSPEPTLPSAEA